SDRRRTTAPRTDRPSPDQDRGPSGRVDGTEAAARPRLTEVAPQTEPPILERRRHTRSRPKRAAGNVSGSPSCTGRAGNARVLPTRPENTRDTRTGWLREPDPNPTMAVE